MDIFLFVLGYIVQLAASGILVYRIVKFKSIYGLSVDTQVCFLAATVSRCVWTLGTRIVDEYPILSAVASLELLLSLTVSAVFVYKFHQLSHTTPLLVPSTMSWVLLISLGAVMAFIVNPGASLEFSSQVLVSFTMYMEALALVPQLWLIRKMDDVEALTSHYIGLLVIARAIRVIFWVVLFVEGQRFFSLLWADVLHTALSADYLYLWMRKLRHGGKLVYTL